MHRAPLALALAFAAGCTPGSPLLDVTGDVTLDGKPVGTGDDAYIRFDPLDQTGTTAQVFVTNGKYTAQLVPGSYRVSVSWTRKTGKRMKGALAGPGQDAEEIEIMVPAKYTNDSPLRADVSRDKTRHDFPLSSK
jgi:hypothetical protein